jgi:hypothetical protein
VTAKAAASSVAAPEADGATATNGATTVEAQAVPGVIGANDALPRGSKADPLVDVSFFEMDVVQVAGGNGKESSVNGAVGDDALQRVRKRRAASAYSRRAGVT